MDVRLFDHGSIIGFAPMTDYAEHWFSSNVASESWQWMGGCLMVDARLARDLIQGLIDSGLELGA